MRWHRQPSKCRRRYSQALQVSVRICPVVTKYTNTGLPAGPRWARCIGSPSRSQGDRGGELVLPSTLRAWNRKWAGREGVSPAVGSPRRLPPPGECTTLPGGTTSPVRYIRAPAGPNNHATNRAAVNPTRPRYRRATPAPAIYNSPDTPHRHRTQPRIQHKQPHIPQRTTNGRRFAIRVLAGSSKCVAWTVASVMPYMLINAGVRAPSPGYQPRSRDVSNAPHRRPPGAMRNRLRPAGIHCRRASIHRTPTGSD
jgi:hypothetical protein